VVTAVEREWTAARRRSLYLNGKDSKAALPQPPAAAVSRRAIQLTARQPLSGNGARLRRDRARNR